jgi:hypothetical protein
MCSRHCHLQLVTGEPGPPPQNYTAVLCVLEMSLAVEGTTRQAIVERATPVRTLLHAVTMAMPLNSHCLHFAISIRTTLLCLRSSFSPPSSWGKARCVECHSFNEHLPSVVLGVFVVFVIVSIGALAFRNWLSELKTWKSLYAIGKAKGTVIILAMQVISQISSTSSQSGPHRFPEPAATLPIGMWLSNLEIYPFIPMACFADGWDYCTVLRPADMPVTTSPARCARRTHLASCPRYQSCTPFQKWPLSVFGNRARELRVATFGRRMLRSRVRLAGCVRRAQQLDQLTIRPGISG